MLIITGSGHSGTKFVSHLFGINHEENNSNINLYIQAFSNPTVARAFVGEKYSENTKECNGFAVPYVPYIKEKYPHATIIQLVRDPRKTVRSFIATDPTGEIRKQSFIFGGETVLEKYCHNWVAVNKFLRELKVPFLRLEDLAGKPINKKKATENFPLFSDWSFQDRETFYSICLEEMKYYNYEKTN